MKIFIKGYLHTEVGIKCLGRAITEEMFREKSLDTDGSEYRKRNVGCE